MGMAGKLQVKKPEAFLVHNGPVLEQQCEIFPVQPFQHLRLRRLILLIKIFHGRVIYTGNVEAVCQRDTFVSQNCKSCLLCES